MKAVMLSIQPKWTELIASAKKTVEVRKTKPKIDVPFKCYIYETKGKLRWCNKCQETDCERPYPNCACWEGQGKVIGEFVCDSFYGIMNFLPYESDDNHHTVLPCVLEQTCLTEDEIDEYLGKKDGYGWHITDLVIYDKPRELSEFKKADCDCPFPWVYSPPCQNCNERDITHPPQSYMFVEELKEN